MKARVKATGEIVEVQEYSDTYLELIGEFGGRLFTDDELEFDFKQESKNNTPDYWEKLKHQYAGMAMQGILNNNLLSSVLFKTGITHVDYINEVVKVAEEYATALVEKLKGE